MLQNNGTIETRKPSFGSLQTQLAACSKAIGESYFPVMVSALAEMLSMRWIFVATVDNSYRRKALTIANWDNGPSDNFSYDLAFSPCENIINQGACCYPANIVDLFPKDQLLKNMGAQSYIGTPLRSSSGEILGILAALDDKPILYPDEAAEIVEVFSGRAAAELERIRTSSLNERLGRMVEDSVSEAYVFDAETFMFELVNRGARDNLGYSMAELRRLTPWDLKPEFSKDEFIDFVSPLLQEITPFLQFETIHQRKNGSTYDVSVRLQYFSGLQGRFFASIIDISERKRADMARSHLAAIVQSSIEAIISMNLDGFIQSWNDGARKIYKYSAAEMIGKPIHILIPPDRIDEENKILADVRRSQKVSTYETIRLRKGNRPINVSIAVSPMFNSSGKLIGVSKIAHDISKRKRAEERERLLMGEVNHRAKNLLTLVQVIARQTAASDPATFVERFEERIFSLAASHDLLVKSGWESISLEELIRSQLAHFQDNFAKRIVFSGPPVRVTATASQAIGMAVHELATNAAKYGALSNDDGTITIHWSLAESADKELRFTLAWKEFGGPLVQVPARKGFGSTVIDRILKSRIGGAVEIDWKPTGLICSMSCLASNILEGKNIEKVRKFEDTSFKNTSNGNRRILVVEDDALIGLEIEEILIRAGYEVLGPVGSVGDAIDLLNASECDGAVLDINLGDETSEPIAEFLSNAGTPYLTVSGRDENDRPACCDGVPHITKPIQSQQLVTRLGQVIAPDLV